MSNKSEVVLFDSIISDVERNATFVHQQEQVISDMQSVLDGLLEKRCAIASISDMLSTHEVKRSEPSSGYTSKTSSDAEMQMTMRIEGEKNDRVTGEDGVEQPLMLQYGVDGHDE